MNTMFFKYAIEVERTRSITQAAENLFMAQPNLSRAIKEAEDSLGFVIFERTSKGVVPTKKGLTFLSYARNIISQLDKLELIASSDENEAQSFSVSIPRSSYISRGLTSFIAGLDRKKGMNINVFETNSMQTIENVESGKTNIGIIRYQSFNEPYFLDYIKEKRLKSDLLWEFECLVLMSASNPLALKSEILRRDLEDMTEVSHGDKAVPYIDSGKIRNDIDSTASKKIYLYERGNQFEILSSVPDTFMWVSPVPEEMLKRYGLVQRKCSFNDNLFKDMLVYQESHTLSALDKKLIDKIYESKTDVCYKEYV